MTVASVTVITSCHKDKEPSYPAGIDPDLLGTWESRIIVEEKTSDLRLTFKADGILDIRETETLTESPIDLTASAQYKAENGVLSVEITECNDPELIGFTYEGKYEVTTKLVNQLYLAYFPLFPFDRVE